MGSVIVAGLGWGDEGKGSLVHHLCSTGKYHTVVRFNGGPQAGHNVRLPSDRHHTFSQFGSGTFHPGVRTHLSRFMLVDPQTLAAEFDDLKALHVSDALDRLTVDCAALLVTPWHRAANRLRESLRGEGRHGSCGMGVGEARGYALQYPGDAPRVGDCCDMGSLRWKLQLLCHRLEESLGRCLMDSQVGTTVRNAAHMYGEFARSVQVVNGDYLHRLLEEEGPVVFEGAQGVLLDERCGFPPYNTWTDTTFTNADTLLREAGQPRGHRLGVVRTYMTRHGPGPFPTEDAALQLPEPDNRDGTWQGPFRAGHFDAVAVRYALSVTGGADGIVLTHLDTAAAHAGSLGVCQLYDIPGHGQFPVFPVFGERQSAEATSWLAAATPVYGEPPAHAGMWPQVVERETRTPVVLVSEGAVPVFRDA